MSNEDSCKEWNAERQRLEAAVDDAVLALLNHTGASGTCNLLNIKGPDDKPILLLVGTAETIESLMENPPTFEGVKP